MVSTEDAEKNLRLVEPHGLCAIPLLVQPLKLSASPIIDIPANNNNSAAHKDTGLQDHHKYD
jgi:hypothetical protein